MSNTNDFSRAAEQFAESLKQYTPKAPEFKTSKSGFEIRAEVLDMAKQFTEFEYSAKIGGINTQYKNGELTTKVDYPEVPGADEVLNTAEKFYSFITKK